MRQEQQTSKNLNQNTKISKILIGFVLKHYDRKQINSKSYCTCGIKEKKTSSIYCWVVSKIYGNRNATSKFKKNSKMAVSIIKFNVYISISNLIEFLRFCWNSLKT